MKHKPRTWGTRMRVSSVRCSIAWCRQPAIIVGKARDLPCLCKKHVTLIFGDERGGVRGGRPRP